MLGSTGGLEPDSTRIVRVTVQVDFLGANRGVSPEVFDKVVRNALVRMPEPGPMFDTADWCTLRIEVADPGDTDSPEWEVASEGIF